MTTTLPDRAETIAALRSELDSSQPTGALLPSHPAVHSILSPGLRTGTVHSFSGGTTLGLALMAGPSMGGSWCAAVGLPNIGLESAHQWSIDLSRLIVVPHLTSQQWLDTVCTLIEGVDLVVAASPPSLAPGARARLLARLRHRRSTLLVAGDWPQPSSTFRIESSRWLGLSEGHGHLRGRELTVTRQRGHRLTTHTIHWPLD